MKIRKMIPALLIVFCIVCGPAAAPLSAFAAESYQGLDKTQTYFTRVIGSLARADYYQTDVLASVTVSQAVFESGWARYTLPVKGNNLFGIKAYSNWTGMCFDPNYETVYPSYYDMMLARGQSYMNTATAWQAYYNWSESVAGHSSLFTGSSNYAAVVGEKDYKAAVRAIVKGGYCSDNGYAETVVTLIERYGYTEFDDLTPDEDGVVAITTKRDQVFLHTGDYYIVGLKVFPEEAQPSEIEWKSDDESVAEVDENGVVTAVGFGQTLISAVLPNGREACCVVYVDCNATVIDASINLRAAPSADSANLGLINIGTPIRVTSREIAVDTSGNAFYPVVYRNSRGESVSGYASADYIYVRREGVEDITVVTDDVTLLPGEEYAVYTVVSPANVDNVSLSWASSDASVASVDENGVVTAVTDGSAVITASAASGVTREIKVTVDSARNDRYALASSYDTLIVRSEPNGSSSVVGRIPFATQMRVLGEPVGDFYKITGLNTSGRSITGYVHAAYMRFVDPKLELKKVTVGDGIKVYEERSDTSYCYGALIDGSTVTVFYTGDDGWSYVLGVKNNGGLNAISGFARLEGGDPGDDPGGDPGDDPTPAESYYGVTTSGLYVRSGPGISNPAVGQFPDHARIIITGEAVDGWYRVSGTGEDGNPVSGYSSAAYVKVLYIGEVNADQLNLRAGPSTSEASLGILVGGEKLIVTGEAENDWYRVEYVKDSQTVSGYCFATYIKVLGRYTVDTPAPSQGFGIKNAALRLENGLLLGVVPGTTASALLADFGDGVTLLGSDRKTLAPDAKVGTGCVAVDPQGREAAVLIKGDVSGDGEIGITDYTMLKRCFLGSYSLDGVYLQAALVSGRGTLSILDYVMVKRCVLGTYKITQ